MKNTAISPTKAFAMRVLTYGQYAALRNAYYNLRALAYSGTSVYCPCCQGQFRDFIHRSNQDNRCPGCNSLRRHRLMALHLESSLKNQEADTAVLHIAPEVALQRVFNRLPQITYVSADLERPAMRKMDITDIPDPDNSYDVIICSHVLEHIPDDRKAMSELWRVLKPTGWAILLVPLGKGRIQTYEDPNVVTPEQRLQAYGQHDHVRIYGTDYFDRLREAGFEVTTEYPTADMEPAEIKRYGLFADDRLFVCKKR